LALIKAVCENIGGRRGQHPQFQDVVIRNMDILLDPLVQLTKLGNFKVKAWAFHALAATGKVGFQPILYERGAVGLAILNLYCTRHQDVMQSTLELLNCVVVTEKLSMYPYSMLAQPDLVKKLVSMLAPFEKKTSRDLIRFRPAVLQLVASLLAKLVPERSLMMHMIDLNCHHLLGKLLGRNTSPMLEQAVVSCMALIYVKAGAIMTKRRYSLNYKVQHDCVALVNILGDIFQSYKDVPMALFDDLKARTDFFMSIFLTIQHMIDHYLIPINNTLDHNPPSDALVGNGTMEMSSPFWAKIKDRAELTKHITLGAGKVGGPKQSFEHLVKVYTDVVSTTISRSNFDDKDPKKQELATLLSCLKFFPPRIQQWQIENAIGFVRINFTKTGLCNANELDKQKNAFEENAQKEKEAQAKAAQDALAASIAANNKKTPGKKN
jgi:hypothetical protein